jgi:hypothetical protein
MNNGGGPQIDRSRQIVWIVGCGRTGSTWLLELLHFFPRIKTWNEPCFGDLCGWIQSQAQNSRPEFVFAQNRRREWIGALQHLFWELCISRFGVLAADEVLVVKEVNAPQICSVLIEMFPASKIVLLLRDPFDVLDSYLDMQQEGSWNAQFTSRLSSDEDSVTQTAQYIAGLFRMAVAGYESFPEGQRYRLSYEAMLADPRGSLEALLLFIGREFDLAEIEASVTLNAFATHWESGRSSFRRFGKAGVWQTSPNFDQKTHAIGSTILGALRRDFGYE